jgi:NADH-quinone oxidoreductase subunit L
MNLSGVPFFFSGAWTKEEILHGTAHWHASHSPHYLMLVGVVLTALYMTRQFIYVFLGNRPPAVASAHESPTVMTWPLIVLAACSILFVAVLTPAWPWLASYLAGRAVHFDSMLLLQPIILTSLALVGAGFVLGWFVYHRAEQIDPLARTQPALFRFLENKFWLDELYDHTILAPARTAARFADWMDRQIWGGLVWLAGALGQLFGIFTKSFDENAINAGADGLTTGARGFGRLMSARHSGQVRTYLGVLAIGMLALLLIYAWLT